MVNALPWEIIMDILCRLSVKDLLRCRCVSEPWRSLIDDPDFIKLHLNHSKQANSNLATVTSGHSGFFWVDLDALGAGVNHPFGYNNEQWRSQPFTSVKSDDQVILHHDRMRFALYNMRRKRAKQLTISSIPRNFYAYSCFGSLVELDGVWDAVEVKKKQRNKKQ
ncbi:F-box protein [Morus notabilis]|uniref:F-box protein n=1 Tax=Morus notabilis TaxID=981085 RepID=W9S030_9ROSA|nr:F-box protein [Morus notabilis]